MKALPFLKLSALLLLIVTALLATSCNRSAAPAAPAVKTPDDAKLAAASLVGVDAAWLAKAKTDYPLTTCVVSGDKLGGDMGPAVPYVYKVAGQPDRLVMFCCADCLDDFTKDPAKYLAKIDAAKK